jgi:hypothetical protein
LETINKNPVRIEDLAEVMRHLTQNPVPAEVLDHRRRLLAEARKVRDEMEPLDEDVKDIIRRQRGEEQVG